MAGAANAINEGTTGICGFTGTAFTGTAATNHAVIVGGSTSSTLSNVGPTATAGQVLQSAGSSADPAFSTATYPSTTTVSQLLYSSATNVVSGLATANSAIITTNSTGVPVATALATDGQLIIGSTAGAPAAATITAGTGITVTNASNSITIAASGGTITWNTVSSSSANVAVNNGYAVTYTAGACTLTLPTTFAIGAIVYVCQATAGGSAQMTLACGGSTLIKGFGALANGSTTAGGTASSGVSASASLFIIGSIANTEWIVFGQQGTWTQT